MVINEIINRRSVREFSDQPVSDEDIIDVIKAGQFAPNSRGNFAEEFIVIREPQLREKLFDLTGDALLQKAPVLIIPVTNTEKTSEALQDLSVVTENMFIQATSLGLGTVWKNISPAIMERIRPVIELPANFVFINIIPLGYPADKPKPHSDTDFSAQKIHSEKW